MCHMGAVGAGSCCSLGLLGADAWPESFRWNSAARARVAQPRTFPPAARPGPTIPHGRGLPTELAAGAMLAERGHRGSGKDCPRVGVRDRGQVAMGHSPRPLPSPLSKAAPCCCSDSRQGPRVQRDPVPWAVPPAVTIARGAEPRAEAGRAHVSLMCYQRGKANPPSAVPAGGLPPGRKAPLTLGAQTRPRRESARWPAAWHLGTHC